jgi:DNA polymerase-3 subunit gamma/tau
MLDKTDKNNSSVLYRKYRPAEWEDVIGQEHIVDSLNNSIKSERIAHAYLFSGSRGTGKTTIARIFARALGINDNDIYEIDAASNRGIDDIREIRDGVHVLPFQSKYKIYIIDEVHMLTKEAFNALLKTLEEPPAHALFVLATTETDKIPETVVSRCQVFSFKKPSREILKNLVTKVAKKEGFTLEAGVADLISVLGDGSFRDTLGILQKVIGSAKDKKIALSEVENTTGAPKRVLVNDFISSIIKGEKDKAISTILLTKENNISIKLFIALVLEKMRIALIIKNAPNVIDKFRGDISEEDMALLSDLAKLKDSKLNSALLLELLKVYDMTGRAYIESLPLEMMVVDKV